MSERLQSLAEMLVAHLMNQGERCMYINENGNPNGCCYFGEIIMDDDGEQRQLMCGAAPLLDKEKMMNHIEFEIINQSEIDEVYGSDDDLVKDEWKDLDSVEYEFVKAVQHIHDQNRGPHADYRKEWKRELWELCQSHGLEMFFFRNFD